MKIVNIILSVLVLLLAAVSAVSSYMLYQKRGLLLGGWNEMASTIHQTAAILDDGSGTDAAAKLSTDALSHENYASLPDNLKTFTSQVRKIQTQRNELGSTIAQIAEILSINNAPSSSDLNNLSNYQTSSNDAVSGVKAVKTREDATVNTISQIASKLGTSVSTENLQSDDYSSELSKLASRVDDINRRIERFDNSIKQIALSSGAGSINLDDDSYATSLTKTVNFVKLLKSNYELKTRELAQKTGELNELARNVKSKDKVLSEYNSQIAELKKTIAIMQGTTPGGKMKQLTPPWKDGSKEALSAVKGQIIDVNNKYGFVVVNLGKNTLVEQKIGKSFNRVNPEISANCDMIVARGLNSDKGQFIGRIKLVKVNEDCSIANVIPESLNGRRINVGDSVYFSNETIAKIGK